MAKGKLILICQSGGEFSTNDDGTMTYNGGEATAANVTSETPFSDLKLNLAETCDLNQETVSVKYFLPGNKRNLITLKNDKDVKRMIDFHGDAITAEVFVMGTPGFDHSAINMQNNRRSGPKNDEVVNNNNTCAKKDEVAKRSKGRPRKKDKKAAKSPYASPAKRTHRALATDVASDEKAEGKIDTSALEGSTGDTSTSTSSEHVNEKADSDHSSDYVPGGSASRKKRKSRSETDVNASPADTVKKRRRTPSWKLGANGQPTIVSAPADDSGGRKSGKAAGETSGGRKPQRKSGRLAGKGDSSRETKPGRKRGRPPTISDQEPDQEVANELLDSGDELSHEISREQLRESHKDSYNKLPWFCEKIVEANPGSMTKLVIGEDKRFKSLFVSFYASFCGFQNSCRPLLFLEATSLRSRFGETLLTAFSIDGNDGFFPVAFGIVDVEDDDSWCWFLEQLKPAILNPQSHPITFVFDREKGLKKPVMEIYENAFIGYSIYHLLESFKRNVKGPFHGDGKAFLPVHFLAAAHSVRVVGFRKSTEQIRLISSQAYDWVMQIEPENWTISSFKGEQYNHITDHVGEAFSKLMEDYRELPILHKIDVIIHTMTDAFNDSKLDASMWSTHLTPAKEREIQEESLRSNGLKVLISSDTLFEVREDSTHVVNISTWSCTCLKWRETGLPCRHALAVFTLVGKNPYEFCSNYFSVDAFRLTYNESINPVSIDEILTIKNVGGENEEVGEVEGGNCETGKMEVEKGGGVTQETVEIDGEKMEVGKGGGGNEEAVETEGEKMEVEKGGDDKEEAVKMKGEKTEVEKEAAAKTEGEKTEVEKGGGENEEAVKSEVEIAEVEKGDGENEETAKTEGGKTDMEKGESENEEAGETGGGENEEAGKTEGEKGESEKDEGSNVVVLPPIPVKEVVEEKEKMEWEEPEGETKRTVTCTKCKQPGHNKKSCNLYQVQQRLYA